METVENNESRRVACLASPGITAGGSARKGVTVGESAQNPEYHTRDSNRREGYHTRDSNRREGDE
ncbi:hypothetical protein [Halorussus lipolyticus]|uniref:hypothetical protein n=1 Tax=Halorussus lipolyticus TaxID=3034024 RepID=UPI0023E85CBF|nr:hypothetical protein [Halorussus sp. DT80]